MRRCDEFPLAVENAGFSAIAGLGTEPANRKRGSAGIAYRLAGESIT
jgi:hypothetical protein